MTYPFNDLAPAAVWRFFYDLTQIPRPSKHEDKVRNYLIDFAQKRHLDYHVDEIGNVIIKKPATSGFESLKGVILQSHIDMVAQKNDETKHDFLTDPIIAYVDGDVVCAKGTTLGADNGMGVAAILAVLDDNNLKHGAIEALFTVDEEAGMGGARGLKGGLLNGDILLNLDYEDEGELCISCAGGVDAGIDIPLKRTPRSIQPLFFLTVKGLRGGHSGVDIHLGRANANMLLAEALSGLMQHLPIELCTFFGGNLRNAIPREAKALVAVADIDKARAQLTDIVARIKGVYESTDPELSIALLPADEAAIAQMQAEIAKTDTSENHDWVTTAIVDGKKYADAILGAHNGIYRMSQAMPNLVETSSNMGIVTTAADHIHVAIMLRSSVDAARDALLTNLAAHFALVEANFETHGEYSGWQPDMNAEILTLMEETGTQVFGHKPAIRAIHAGLECGILGANYPHWQMISFGPTIQSPHSPNERVNIASVTRFYEWLLATLAAIPKK